MTRDEIRRAIGSYATGSLTESERKALYEAALQDQELFDELAGEHVFKEVLEEPGAKARLIAALSNPEPKAQSHGNAHGWRWATVAMVTASVVIVILAGRAKFSTKAPVEVARVLSVAPQNAPEPAAPPPVPAPKPTLVAPKNRVAEVQKDEKLATPPAAPVTSQDAVSMVNQTASAGAVGGFAAPRAAAPSFKAALMKPARFAFDYSIESGNTLVIKTSAIGYLKVVANSRTGPRTIFPATGTGRVAVDSLNRLPIPPDTPELVITFSAQPDSDTQAGLPTISENPSGTLEDANPSPESKLVLNLRLRQ